MMTLEQSHFYIGGIELLSHRLLLVTKNVTVFFLVLAQHFPNLTDVFSTFRAMEMGKRTQHAIKLTKTVLSLEFFSLL